MIQNQELYIVSLPYLLRGICDVSSGLLCCVYKCSVQPHIAVRTVTESHVEKVRNPHHSGLNRGS